MVATVFGSFALEDLDDSQQPNVCQPGLILPNLKKVVEFYPMLWNVVLLIMLSGVVMGVISFTMMHFLPTGLDSERISSYGTFFNGLGPWFLGTCVWSSTTVLPWKPESFHTFLKNYNSKIIKDQGYQPYLIYSPGKTDFSQKWYWVWRNIVVCWLYWSSLSLGFLIKR